MFSSRLTVLLIIGCKINNCLPIAENESVEISDFEEENVSGDGSGSGEESNTFFSSFLTDITNPLNSVSVGKKFALNMSKMAINTIIESSQKNKNNNNNSHKNQQKIKRKQKIANQFFNDFIDTVVMPASEIYNNVKNKSEKEIYDYSINSMNDIDLSEVSGRVPVVIGTFSEVSEELDIDFLDLFGRRAEVEDEEEKTKVDDQIDQASYYDYDYETGMSSHESDDDWSWYH